MSLGVKLDQVRGPGPPGDRLARVTFRGNRSHVSTILLLIFIAFYHCQNWGTLVTTSLQLRRLFNNLVCSLVTHSGAAIRCSGEQLLFISRCRCHLACTINYVSVWCLRSIYMNPVMLTVWRTFCRVDGSMFVLVLMLVSTSQTRDV